ncbi:YbgC/FadM family acyl-CoA thioesterase [Campylobacter hepaticus]|uniref:YbgC/FadM family acyl-CoA thioesterase n=1 Tax=Campylobacter hepaticus TaxID=1813019 RepID=A0A424Z091_9BACT|nr:YbgC/FadM family acyl-CoA thioesterase [Campylobacter hepaticus]AXP08521.1 YbgC/FadM family acyl-CoA thioesterase [Campylobacter hepaticus]MCZ0772357.1 YbgC/FadM family acyl-CoA thioesterase [Campylobacter hepaticus]MCZ0773825.1 YbgC/FadM family acyl-CoA thioesterase [Campylobacter hepaticus]MCZ0775076.1 YbgC/FadM family acyl-CoA thioesterase [Campylobacter hepaticus]MDX2322945.1 YbgC/FadM family acyl-CoA thioesterase [Campylobacter hepaticus]
MKIRIYYEDTDAGGVVYHSNYLKFCERARSEFFFVKKIDIFDTTKGHFLLTKANCNFIKSAKLGDIIEVKNKILKIKHVSVEFFQEIYKDKDLLFTMVSTLAYINKGKLIKMDLSLKKVFEELF